MLFPRNALAAGPQARFGAKIDLKSEGGQGEKQKAPGGIKLFNEAPICTEV
jgi:hypothetical protein